MRTKPLTPDYFGDGMYGFNDRNGRYVIEDLGEDARKRKKIEERS